jgi:membrane carboxypeptidase/penicillin-binding protein
LLLFESRASAVLISGVGHGKFTRISKEYYSWEKTSSKQEKPFYARKIVWIPVAALTVAAFAGWVVFGVLTSRYQQIAEQFNMEEVGRMESASILYDRKGREFGKLFIQNRQPVPYERLPEMLVKAVISAEDNRFYSHDGVDYMGIARAAITNYREGRIAQGASTVTQQVARNSFELRERTYERKLVEMYLAWRIEKHFSKKQIMEFYLNRVYFGSGFYGAEAAAQGYFGKSAIDMSIGECATLAGLLKSPQALSPFNNIAASQESRNVVLKRMRELGYLTRKEYSEELESPLRVVQRTNPFKVSYANELIRQQAIKALGFERAMNGGYRIQTTLDIDVQREAEKALGDSLSNVESQPGYDHPTFEQYRAATNKIEAAINRGNMSKKMPDPKYLQGAALLVENTAGGILAMVGGRDFRHSEYNRAVQGKRPVGTVFTPFVFTTAYQSDIFPGELVQDACIDNRYVMVGGETGILGEWGVEVAENEYEGPITTREALVKGKNAATVRLGMKVGLDAVKKTAAAVGISSPLREYANAFLGSSELSLDELVLGYTVFPNVGERPSDLYIIQSIAEASGNVIFKAPRKRYRAIEPSAAYQTHSILSDYMENGLGALATKQFGLPRIPVGGKSGTAYGFTDTYFLGYTSAVTCGVWVGFDKPTKIYRGAFGKDLALPIWSKIMATAAKSYPSAPINQPSDLKTVEICRSSGLLATPRCSTKSGDNTAAGNVYSELATEKQLPTIPCDVHGGGIRSYAKEFGEADWPRAAAAIDLSKIRPIAVVSPSLLGFNDVYRSVRPGAEFENDDEVPVAKAIPVNVPPPAAEAVAPSSPQGEVEVRRAQPVDSPSVDSQSPPMEAPALAPQAPEPIDFFN